MARHRLLQGEPQQCASPRGSTALLPVRTVLVRLRSAHLLRPALLARRDAIGLLKDPTAPPMVMTPVLALPFSQETLADG